MTYLMKLHSFKKVLARFKALNCLKNAKQQAVNDTILKSVNLKCVNVFKIASFLLSIPGTSAYCERIFSVMSSKWRNERNRCFIKLMKSELFIYFNLKDTCREFSEKIKRDPQLLKSPKSQKKYNFKN